VKTGSGARNSEKGIADPLKGASKSKKLFGKGKTRRGKFKQQFTPEIVSPLINQQQRRMAWQESDLTLKT
jgi:hypothetical protein